MTEHLNYITARMEVLENPSLPHKLKYLFILLLTETVLGPKFRGELSNCEVLLGGDAKFEVNCSGKPAPDIRW